MVSGDNLSRAIHQILLEIPLHLAWKRALLSEIAVERMYVVAFYADLAKQWKRQTILGEAEIFDLRIRPWFLLPEVVRGERQDLKA